MNKKSLSIVAGFAALSLGLMGCTTEGETPAESFPTKDIRLIIQANPGGGSDLSSRALAAELEKSLGVSVIAENMPGASGAKAMEYVAEQPADGYTIGFGPVEIAMLNTTQNANVTPDRYTMLGQIMSAPGVIAVSAKSPYNTLEELLEASKQSPKTVSNSGVGSIWEAGALGISKTTGAQLTPVAYDGGATAVAAAASGEVDASISGVGEAVSQGDAVRILAVLHSERHPKIPDVPTAKEIVGVDLEYAGWGGIYAPAGLPNDVKSVLEKAIADGVASSTYKDFQDNAGNLVIYKNSAEFTSYVTEQFNLFKDLLG